MRTNPKLPRIRLRQVRRIILAILILVSLFGVDRANLLSQPQRSPGRVIEVLDGDSVRVSHGGTIKIIRMIGIDAPESRKGERVRRIAKKKGTGVKTQLAYGEQSKEFLRSLLPEDTPIEIELGRNSTDKYGRTLGYIFLRDGRMANEAMLSAGYAYLYTFPPNTEYETRFKRAFKEARDGERGLWQK